MVEKLFLEQFYNLALNSDNSNILAAKAYFDKFQNAEAKRGNS